MKVIQYSVGRSGSTLVTQIVNSLDGVEVRATHIYRRNLLRRKMIIPYRDFRDVLVSKWRANEGISGSKLLDGARKMQEAELQVWLPRVKSDVVTLDRNLKSNPHALLLQYEKFVNDYDYIFDRIEGYLGRKFTSEQKVELSKKFSLKANKNRSDQMKSFSEWDEAGIHGNHVFTGEVGTWRKVVEPSAQAMVDEQLKDELEKWGYAV